MTEVGWAATFFDLACCQGCRSSIFGVTCFLFIFKMVFQSDQDDRILQAGLEDLLYRLMAKKNSVAVQFGAHSVTNRKRVNRKMSLV